MKLPTFSLPADDGKAYTNNDFLNGFFIIFLYPKDNTPGCTQEAKDFRDEKEEFDSLGIQIFGLSKDSLKSHHRFREKYNLNFPLLSDENTVLIDALGAWKEKSIYGKTFMGVSRSTYLIQNGTIIKKWEKVKVHEHAAKVRIFCKTLK